MGSHYYTKDGELIDGDLRVCRKLNGLPSPTTVLNILGSPGLKSLLPKTDVGSSSDNATIAK